MTKVNPIQLQKYLKGLSYPVKKKDLIDKAKENGADENVLESLEQIPEKEYESPIGVTEEIGNLE